MDKIAKALNKLHPKERAQIKDTLLKLQSGDAAGLDIKKLNGRDDIFRIRRGNFRILYRLETGTIFILAIERRNEKTYRI